MTDRYDDAAIYERIECRLERIEQHVIDLRIGLAVHKARTSWLALSGSALISLMIGLGAYLLN